jgi:hypothetical protein
MGLTFGTHDKSNKACSCREPSTRAADEETGGRQMKGIVTPVTWLHAHRHADLHVRRAECAQYARPSV